MRVAVRIWFGLITLAVVQVGAADSIDPGNDGSQYAWSESAGWVNAEPGGDGGSGMRVGQSTAGGWLWSETVGWISLSCVNTDSCQVADYGIQHDGLGALWGYAWSENAGWISFSCQNTGSCGNVDFGVTFDLINGRFLGHAWSENLGWISFDCENSLSCGNVDFGLRTSLDLLLEDIFVDGFE